MAKRLALREVYDPTKEKHLTPTVDLVLVHGLDGDATKSWTWQDQGSEVFWPAKLLPEERPRTRVLSFAYNADMFHNNTDATIRDSARSLLALLNVQRRKIADPRSRPIVFVGHCLGGLVIKQAMCFANSEAEYASIESATKAIIFFGTPHGGADKESWKSIASGYSFLAGPSSSLVGAITRASDDLEEIKEDFVKISPRYPITSFYEKGHWGKTGKCIVNPTSATMMIGNECAMGVDGDHRVMCQFEDAQEAAFQVMCQRIEIAVGLDVVERKEDGRGTVGNELAVSSRQESQTMPMWSADGDRGMGGGDMGGYTAKRVMMIDFEKRVPEDEVLRNLRRDRVMVADDTPGLKPADCVTATSSPVPQPEVSREGRGRRFLGRFNKLWG
ncbi:uncharacterized protein B0H64DRAFT_395244 [Chaetomium fimeti]|uniref:DUF676 domain-containing protein n=1 Tax=Chaetomium fimeti TaxID=1854472 RepID=A0AAE0LSP5_9PEZI|nr:hypothetical protein B0H64DRAFT_395244 [Chaetomium fimeti]